MTDRYDPKAIADELRARAETLRAVFPTDGTAWDDARLDAVAADTIDALVKERDQAIRDLDAGFAESDHLSAKYYQRMRAAEREMHARELHHFEEEQKSAGLAAVVEKVRGVIGAEIGWESPAVLIDRIQWALSTAPTDALAEHDRQVAERAWDEGYGSDEECGVPRRNPYRKEQENNNA